MARAGTTYNRIATADTNAAVIATEAVKVLGYQISNTNAAVRYVKFYNKATAPDQNDTPVIRVTIPAGQTVSFNIPGGVQGFTAGLGMRITTGVLDNDNTAVSLGDCVVGVFYDTLR